MKKIKSLMLSSGELIRLTQLKRLSMLHHYKNDVTAAKELNISVGTLYLHILKMKQEFNNCKLVENYINSDNPKFTQLGERMVKFYQSVKNVYEKYNLPLDDIEIYEILVILEVHKSGSLALCERSQGWSKSLVHKRIRRYERILKSKIYVKRSFTDFGLKICNCGYELELLILELEIDIEEIKNNL